jgi:hypothetical protein
MLAPTSYHDRYVGVRGGVPDMSSTVRDVHAFIGLMIFVFVLTTLFSVVSRLGYADAESAS